MHQVNAGYTLFARLAPGREGAARAVLAKFDADHALLPFADTATTHFATLTIIPEHRYGDEILPATLLLATSFCGPANVHVRELVDVLGDGLREVFAHCEEFPVDCPDEELVAFITEHRHADTFYSGMQHLSPRDVRRHRELRDAIQHVIDTQTLAGSAVEIRRAIQQHIRALPGFAWAEESFAPPRAAFFALHWRTLIVLGVAGALLAATALDIVTSVAPLHVAVVGGWIAVGAFVAFLVALVLAVRHDESEQTYVASRQPDADVRALAATQDRPVINEFTISGPVKEGRLRPVFLQIAMWVIARVAEGIPLLGIHINIPTVATARWIAADRGRRLIFISNYTNSAEPYVRDFIDVPGGAMRINLTFGFGRGYPKTEWVVMDGAVTDPNGFIYVVTANQSPTCFWYGPYRNMSIDNIKLDRKIREGLYGDLDEDGAKQWLHLL